MMIRASDLRRKDVVSVRNGQRIGMVSDFEVEIPSSNIVSLIVYGNLRFFGIFGRKKDIIIRWSDIQLIGEDTILVSCDVPSKRKKR